MKSLILLLTSLLTITAQAATPEMLTAICANTVKAHPSKPGFWHIDRPSLVESSGILYATETVAPNDRGGDVVVKVDSANPSVVTEVLRFDQSIQDIEVFEGQLFVLFNGHLKAFDLATWAPTVDVSTGPAPTNQHDVTRSLTVVGGLIVITAGTQGAIVYVPKTKQMLPASNLGMAQEGGHLSKLIDVTRIDDSSAAFTVEGVTVSNDPPFALNGVLVWDLTNNDQRIAGYDRKASGVLSNAVLQVRGDQVLINNWGILHRASLSSVRTQKPIVVNWTPINFEVNGQKRPGELMGDLLAENNQLLACAQTNYQDTTTNKVVRKGVV